MCHAMLEEVRGQLAGVGFLLLPVGSGDGSHISTLRPLSSFC